MSSCSSFYPRGASSARVIAMIACQCVCLCVTRRYCIKTAKRRITQTTPRDSSGSLVLWRQNSLVDYPPSPWNLRSKWPTPLSNKKIRPISAHSASTVRASEKSSIIANRKSTTRFPRAIDEPCTLPLTFPKGDWHKTRFCYFFPVNFNFCRKKSATKFFCVKTSSSNVLATSFPYLTVHRWIAGDVPIYMKSALKLTHPVEKRRFRQISLNSAANVRASKKSSISTNRKSTTRFPSSHRWTLCVTPKSPKGGLKRKFLHLALPVILSLHVIVDILNLICGLNIASPSLRTTNCPWKGRGHVMWPILNFYFPLRYLWNGLS